MNLLGWSTIWVVRPWPFVQWSHLLPTNRAWSGRCHICHHEYLTRPLITVYWSSMCFKISSSSSSYWFSTLWGRCIVAIAQGNLIVDFCAFAAILSVILMRNDGKERTARTVSSASTPTAPPASPHGSLACFRRTSFYERYVLGRSTFSLPCLTRKIRSSAERNRAPLTHGQAHACTVYIGVDLVKPAATLEEEDMRTNRFYHFATIDIFDEIIDRLRVWISPNINIWEF